MADFAASLTAATDLEVMDMGGGLGIAYTRADRPAAVEDYAEAVVEAVRGEWGRVGLPSRASWSSRAAASSAAPA